MQLPADVRTLVRVSAALASRDPERIGIALERAVDHEPAREVEEILLQAYLFLGFPAALNAIAQWRELSGRPAPEASEDDLEAWVRRGETVCRRVYGDRYPGLRRNIATLHPDMDRWMVSEGYGKVLGREGASLEVRELCVAALLAVLDAPVQLYSHVRGCIRLGLDPEVVWSALEVAGEYGSEETRSEARAVFDRVMASRSEPDRHGGAQSDT